MLAEIIFHETSTLGVRIYTAERRVQARTWVEVETPHGKVRDQGFRATALSRPNTKTAANSRVATGLALKHIIAEANFAYLKTIDEILPHHPDLLRQRGAAHRPHVHHHGRRY